jgi:hypothetical protein
VWQGSLIEEFKERPRSHSAIAEAREGDEQMIKKALILLLLVGLILAVAMPAFADQPPGQHGYEGQPGNQGNGQHGYEGQPGNQGNGQHGYEGQPGNQGGH